MPRPLTSQATKVLALANDAARSFNHAYVGTEHILLALMEANSTELSHILATFDVTAQKIRAEIERLVTRGDDPIPPRTLPLTPRATQVIEHARQEALFMNETSIAPEHLFLGLTVEPSGVASQVLLNLGVRPAELRSEVFKVRIAQMKFVERAIRPVCAGTACKRKMREELLAHFGATYDQELAWSHDPVAALNAAAERFGDPADLAQELQNSLLVRERVSYFIERFVQYRAPESAARYSFRMAKLTFIALSAIFSLTTIAIFLRYGWSPEVKTLSRVFAAITFATPPAQYVVWLAYIKMRDALWGAFGSRKSLIRVLTLGVLTTATATAYLALITCAARLSFDAALQSAGTIESMSVLGTIALVVLARLSGSGEIRDTLWALLDLSDAKDNSTGSGSVVEPT